MNDYKSFLSGGLIGVIQTISGHPLDTLKTISQNNKLNIKDINKLNIFKKPLSLYKGLKYPLTINIIYNTFLFSIFENINNKTNNNIYSGFIAGFYSGIILSPFEYYKINRQLGNKIIFVNSFKGIHLTMFREGLASSIYFSSYFALNKLINNPLISGGISGSLSWLATYPLDTIKTQYQSGKITFDELFNKRLLLNKNNWNGFSFCITRAFLVNSISFYCYDKLNDDLFYNNKIN